jgi:hypothetical protein
MPRRARQDGFAAPNCGNATVSLETLAIPHPEGKRGRAMSSYSTRFEGQSIAGRSRKSTRDSPMFGDAAHLRLVSDGTDVVLAHATAAIERVEQEIDDLWFDSMKAEDLAMSQRLADVSHALQRAARLVEPDNVIG